METNKPKKILVIDNTRETYSLCKSILYQNYTVVWAEGAKDGIEIALKEPPDLILLDLKDEIGQGFQLCRKLERAKATRNIPIVILSGSGDEKTIEEANSLGVVDFIHKPIIPTFFIKRIQTLVERYSGRMNRCRKCLKPMQIDWAYCPYDGSKLPPVRSR